MTTRAPMHQRSRAAARQRAYRLRRRAGLQVVPVPLPAAAVETLIAAGLLPVERDAGARDKGVAISRLLERLASIAARRTRNPE